MAKLNNGAAPADTFELGDNITGYIQGDETILVIKHTERLGESSSGKSDIVASTRGNVAIPGLKGVIAGINIYVKK